MIILSSSKSSSNRLVILRLLVISVFVLNVSNTSTLVCYNSIVVKPMSILTSHIVLHWAAVTMPIMSRVVYMMLLSNNYNSSKLNIVRFSANRLTQ